MATPTRTEDRIAKIADPRQRAVAARIGTICDWFSVDIVAQPPGERFLSGEKAGPGESSWRHRNIARKYACGAAAALLEDLGVPLRDRHGRAPKGRTEIEEMKGLHPGSTLEFLALFRALCLDRGDFGTTIAGLYARLVAQAKAEVDAATVKGAA